MICGDCKFWRSVHPNTPKCGTGTCVAVIVYPMAHCDHEAVQVALTAFKDWKADWCKLYEPLENNVE